MCAATTGNLDVANRLVDFQKMQIRAGFEISYSHGSLYFPVDLMELVVEFAYPEEKKKKISSK